MGVFVARFDDDLSVLATAGLRTFRERHIRRPEARFLVVIRPELQVQRSTASVAACLEDLSHILAIQAGRSEFQESAFFKRHRRARQLSASSKIKD